MTEDVSDAPQTLASALLAFQADPPQFIKDAEAEVKAAPGKRGYTYKYLTLQSLLAGLRPRLAELGLLWVAKPDMLDGKAVLHYELRFEGRGMVGRTTELIEGKVPLMVGNSMQTYGGALSFARRYALLTVLNLAPDVDEDGAVPAAQQDGTKVSRAVAGQLYDEAAKLNRLPRLRLAASTVAGEDIGDCSTKAKATKALQRLTREQAERLFEKLAEIAGQG